MRQADFVYDITDIQNIAEIACHSIQQLDLFWSCWKYFLITETMNVSYTECCLGSEVRI